MTPKDKAEELVHIYDLLQTYVEGFSLDNAKQCALILVNEMIDNCDNSIVNEFIRRGAISYWQEVKQEIQKL